MQATDRVNAVRCIDLVLSERHEEAGVALEGLLPGARADAQLSLVVGHVAFALGRYAEALHWLEHAARAPGGAGPGLEALASLSSRVGLSRVSLEASARLRALGGSSPKRDRSELVLRSRLGDVEGATALARELHAKSPAEPALTLELVGLLVRGRELDAARGLLRGLGAPASLPEALERASLLVEVDACDEAVDVVAAARRAWPDAPEPLVALSRHAAWRGDGEAAERHARAALELAPADASAWCALAAAHHVAGRPDASEDAALRACALGDAPPEAHAWRAEAAARRGAVDDAMSALIAAINADEHGLVVGPLMQLVRLSLTKLPAGAAVGPYRLEELVGALEELVPDASARLEAGQVGPTREVLDAALAALRGNRGVQATMVRDGRLRRLGPAARDGPRLASRRVLDRLRFAAAEAVLAALDDVERRFPRSPLPLAHRGELLLWLGNLDAAEADFRAAIARVFGTRFAWIGLCGVELLRGRLNEALAVCAEGVRAMGDTSGPAVFVYRGEAYRRLGRLEEARADLEAAVAASPRRVSAWLNLALVREAQGDGAWAEARLAEVADAVPALVSDARCALQAQGRPASHTAMLEQCLELMRGNRSASLLTWCVGGELRVASPRAGMQAGAQALGLHELRRLRASFGGPARRDAPL